MLALQPVSRQIAIRIVEICVASENFPAWFPYGWATRQNTFSPRSSRRPRRVRIFIFLNFAIFVSFVVQSPLRSLVAALPRWDLRGKSFFFVFGCGVVALGLCGEITLLLWLQLRRAAFYTLDQVASIAAAVLHGGGRAWLHRKRKTLYLGAAI